MTEKSDKLRKMASGISLGLFAGDFGNLRRTAQDATGWGCRILHFDIMDGVFVPAMTAGPGMVKALDLGVLRDVHLMVQHPARHVASYVKAGADIITVHAEAEGAADAIGAIRNAADEAGRAVIAGLALMPETTLDQARELLALKPDMILVLSLDPRGKNPPDISAACARVAGLREQLGQGGPLLAFDGGVTLASIDEIKACAPNIIVTGSAVLGASDPGAAYKVMTTAS